MATYRDQLVCSSGSHSHQFTDTHRTSFKRAEIVKYGKIQHPKRVKVTTKDKPLVKFKSHLYYEEKDNVSEAEKTLRPSKGSQMIMYKNGKSQGVAYDDLFEGIYYPAISLYKNAKVTINFGPEFKHQPEGLMDFRAMSEAAPQTMVEYALADVIYHIDNEGKLPEF